MFLIHNINHSYQEMVLHQSHVKIIKNIKCYQLSDKDRSRKMKNSLEIHSREIYSKQSEKYIHYPFCNVLYKCLIETKRQGSIT